MTIRWTKLCEIFDSPDVQIRDGLDRGRVAEYAEAMLAGDKLPKPILFFDKLTYWLASGFHRYEAALLAGLDELECDVRPGTQRDAMLFALSDNKHGLSLTVEEKRRAVERMLGDAEWSKMSDREIARHIGVSNTMVSKTRAIYLSTLTDRTVNPEATETRIVTRNGVTYKQSVAGINANRAKPEVPADANSTPAPATSNGLHLENLPDRTTPAAPAPSHGGVESEPTPPVFTDRSLANPLTRLCDQAMDDVTDVEPIEPIANPAPIEPPETPPAPPAVAPVATPAEDMSGMGALFAKIQDQAIALAEAHRTIEEQRRTIALQAIEISDLRAVVAELRAQTEALRAELREMRAERTRETT